MTYRQDVWSWQRHLRSGGTTSWQEWLLHDRPHQAVPTGWSPPGAAQLELVRRLGLHAARDRVGPEVWLAALADRVTSRSGPGRGLGQQPLLWPRGEAPAPRRVGAPPVDPAAVPVEELVRVGVGVLTELLLDASQPVADPGGSEGLWSLATATRRRTTAASATTRLARQPSRTPRFAVDGAPVTAAVVRRALSTAGHVEHPEGDRATRVVLLAEPFDQALAQAWSARVQRGAPARWAGFVARWSGRRELPPSVDLPALAGAWADRVGAAQVHVVVVPPGDHEDAVRLAAEILGLRPGRRGTPAPPGTAALPPAAVDAARRVNAVLGVRVAPPEHDAALRRLLTALPVGPSRMPLTVPTRLQAWARMRAERLAETLDEGGYPVHGSLGGIVPGFHDLPTRPDVGETLELVLTTCLGLARRPWSEGAGSGG